MSIYGILIKIKNSTEKFTNEIFCHENERSSHQIAQHAFNFFFTQWFNGMIFKTIFENRDIKIKKKKINDF